MPRNLANTITRHALNHILTIRHRHRHLLSLLGIAPDPNKPTRRKLINLTPRPRIQMQRDPVAFLLRLPRVSQHRRVIPANLRATRPLGRRTIKVLQDQRRDGMNPVVDTRGHDVHAKSVLLGRIETQLRAGPE